MKNGDLKSLFIGVWRDKQKYIMIRSKKSKTAANFPLLEAMLLLLRVNQSLVYELGINLNWVLEQFI